MGGDFIFTYSTYIHCYHITVCVFVFVCVDIREKRCRERRKEERRLGARAHAARESARENDTGGRERACAVGGVCDVR